MGEIFDTPGLLLQFFNLLGIFRKSKENKQSKENNIISQKLDDSVRHF